MVLGYYYTCDDALCEDCAEVTPWEGFESWEEPLPIFSDEELDSPQHCSECGVLLGASLTTEGVGYVAESIRESLEAGVRNPVTHQWADEYGDDVTDSGMLTDGDFLKFFALPINPVWETRDDLRKYLDHI